MKPWVVLAIALSLSGCFHAPIWPKLVEIRYQAADGKMMSLLCVHETRADTPPVTYECDTKEIRGVGLRK